MSKLLSGSRIEEVASSGRPLPSWLVVDRYSETLKHIYELEPSPQLTYLFHETKYAPLDEHSPLVVRIAQGGNLWTAYVKQQDPSIRQGVIITSEAAEKDVLKHLRQCLEIQFYAGRKALFRFYDASIASVFFSADSTLDRWLGPLERVIWFGGTWEQVGEYGKRWYSCLSETLQHPQQTEKLHGNDELHKLSSSQETAMENFVLIQGVWRKWIKNNRADEFSAENISYFSKLVLTTMQLELPSEHLQKALEIFLTLAPGQWLAGVGDLPAVNRLQEIERRAEHHSQSKTRSSTV